MAKKSASSTARVEDQLCFALYAASRAATAAYRPHLDRAGLTYPRCLVMLVLWELGEVSVGDLGRRLFLDSGTLSPLLRDLETDGLVARYRHREDERVVKVRLTAHGRALEETMAEMRRDLSCKLTLSAAQADELRDRVRMLFNQLVQIAENSNEAGVHSRSDSHGRPGRARHFVGQKPGRASVDAERAGRQRRVRDHQS